MFFFKRRALLILFTITLGLVILNSNNGISLLSNHPAITVIAAPENTNNTLVITHGIASGDITNESAVVWSRSNRESLMHVEYGTNLNFSQPQSNAATLTNQTTDYTSHVKLEGLSPDILYYYRGWFSIPPSSQVNNNYSLFSDTLAGSFRTRPFII
jgi:alkaline phosphatase D